MDMNLSKVQEIVEDKGAWHATVCGVQRDSHNLATEKQLYLRVRNPEVAHLDDSGKASVSQETAVTCWWGFSHLILDWG